MYNPVSTYRLQFNKDFSFADARQQLDYFHILGAGTVYASPVFAATPGSPHGYDITNPHMINPEIGTEEELRKLTKSFKNRRIGWIQDIVPNHMAFNSHNLWLMDVLEKGKDSEYASVFDIDRQHPRFRSKLMLPFLGDVPEKVLEKGHLTVTFKEGSFFLKYFDHLWPLRFESFLWMLEQSDNSAPSSFRLLTDQHQLEDKSPDYLFLNGEWERFKEELSHLCHSQKAVQEFCRNLALEISQNQDSVQALFENQHYSPVYWKETEERINYRRFFTVNDLICLRMEDEDVFNLYHRELRRWLNNHLFDGLRIDHIDGLRYPGEYLTRIRKLAGQKRHLSVEKILEKGEVLPTNWPVQGTTGYDFLAEVNNLFTRTSGMTDLQALFYKITHHEDPAEEVIYKAKKLILTTRMQGEWDNLITLFLQLRLLEGETAEQFTRDQIKAAVGEILLCMPVYRLYPEILPLADDELKTMKGVFVEALQRNSVIEPVLSAFEELLFSENRSKGDRDHRILHFFSRMMQLAGPLMAKGVEDTAMYRYNCFIAHNEVGDAIASEGLKVSDFHEHMIHRQEQYPFTLNTTSTHDTKRGEDVRARLNIISEIPEEWEEAVNRWIEMNKIYKKAINSEPAPSAGEEYLIYQTLVGITPIDGTIDEDLIGRMETYLEKALREAKEHSSWSRSNSEWEEAVKSFLHQIFNPSHGFREDFLKFHQKVAHYGIFNSLSQLTLKCTCPGIPDIYRGNEMWDFTLVDPDNRQAVDFDYMHRTLKNLKEHYTLRPGKLFPSLMKTPENGHIKLWLTHRLLRYRKENPAVFASGEYIPLKTKGIHQKNILAFARHHNDVWHITIVPLNLTSFEQHGKPVLPFDIDWKNTRVLLPDNAPTDWVNVFSGRPYSTGPEIAVSEIFDAAPVGIFHADAGRKARTAGVLMHVTSLPGRFASGDFGPNAYRFIDFLKESGHSYWQVLPFTQTTALGEWSPYSAPSAFAGNIMMISPRKLAEESLISKKELMEFQCAISEKADFAKALSIREELTRSAYENFITHCSAPAKQDFYDFCKKEAYWLNDYALFLLFKRQFDGTTWNEWPASYRDRDPETLKKAQQENERKIELEKYRQYLFYQQWHELKRYANHHGIRIIGDVPIYVSYDNADVWSHPHLFKLNADKSMHAVAGVPPDYFSETGQLWNMPVFNWKNLEKENFKWWIQRIAKNMELFDMVRLDHFRGFEAYWEVPANEETAENGTWVKAPGKQFFKTLKKKFPAMPFIAEDLGEIDNEVYKLRDMFHLPGMKVLQFAFGDDLPESVHIPHNYNFNSVVYTGTHDNNTAQGWFRQELDKAAIKRLKLYTGNKIKGKNVHRILTRLAWASQARLVVIPVQDLLGKGQEAQMNKPSVAQGNWTWRLKTMDDLNRVAGETRELLGLFSR
jgi:malto-oligosyltrehalose synthase/4-alpha-glucanotransferase